MSNRKSVVLSQESIKIIKDALMLKITVLEDIIRADERRSYKGSGHKHDVAELATYKATLRALD